ncbi:MAG: LysR family transcriptional regulator [Actinomycetota bacterium]
MTPAQLKTFAAIVRHGSAKAAAAELGVSEAAVSAHTAALRKELNDPLYRRSANGLAFTPGGLRLATRAAELLGLQDLTRREVRAAGDGRRVLRLATTALFAEYAAPGLIELFKTRANDLDVEMSVEDGDRFVELLASRQADVTIGPVGGQASALAVTDQLTSREFLRYQLVLVVHPKHALAKKRVTARQLTWAPWLLGPSAAEVGGATATLLRRFAVPEDQQRIFQSHAAALAEVADGNGIGIAPEFRVREALAAGRLHRISAPGADAQATWTATTLAASQASAVAVELGRFVSTPRAIQAMLSGKGSNVGRFRPRVHVTLWS